VKRWGLGVAVLLVLGGAIAAAFVLASQPAHHAKAAPATTTTRPKPKPPPHPRPRVRGPHNRPVPILMYHVLGTPPPSAAYPQLYVKRADLAGQLRWLARNGYHAVTLGRVFRYWREGVSLPPKPVVLSFDDGYLSDYTVAMPALRRYRWPGVLNLVVDNVAPGDLTGPQVRALIAAGWEIDAHTISHVDLTTLGAAQLRHEVAGSRRLLRHMFGQPVNFFCYPVGRYDARVVAAVRAAGYLGATTVNPGLGQRSEPYTLNRIRVDLSDGVFGFGIRMRRYTSERPDKFQA
jgi:peptidoglycan/xylan/chitin deacetylase (PgdA/CDA1 family)